jgi:hypothetical protein
MVPPPCRVALGAMDVITASRNPAFRLAVVPVADAETTCRGWVGGDAPPVPG